MSKQVKILDKILVSVFANTLGIKYGVLKSSGYYKGMETSGRVFLLRNNCISVNIIKKPKTPIKQLDFNFRIRYSGNETNREK